MNKTTFKKLRLEKGYTQSELAKAIGMSVPMISYMENGHKPISKRTAIAVRALPRNRNKAD
jgi:transcriptional regulator with XRE-family HTH domain